MVAQRESKLVKRITTAVQERWPDAWIFKVHGGAYQKVGVPDLLVCIEGQLIAMEVKAQRPGESEAHARDRVTALQRAQIDVLNRAGARTFVTLTVEESVDCIASAVWDRQNQ